MPRTVIGRPSDWADRLRRSLPGREDLVAHRWLRPVAGRLLDARLWRVQHESVARGVAVGTFWAFVIPAAQVLVAAAHCTWWRANIPAAAAMTMVTNPLTISFWLWLAYQVGARVLGESGGVAPPPTGDALGWLSAFGWPTVLGVGLFGVGGAAGGYLAVKVFWRWRVWVRRRRRRNGV